MELDGRSFPAETVDLSHNGMVALLDGVDLGEGRAVGVKLTHPNSEASVKFDGQITNQTLCDHGVMAVGVQFQYALERVDEITQFIDEVRAIHRAKELASVSGSLEDTKLETVLVTFSGIAMQGTISLTRGPDEGKIIYAEGEILQATTGLVSGAKALGRMFSWTDARFEFHPEVGQIEGVTERLPLESAVLAASVERDEIRRLDLASLNGESVFSLDDERFQHLKGDLGELQLEVADHAGMDFSLEVILDMLSANDAAIYNALVGLIESGVLSPT